VDRATYCHPNTWRAFEFELGLEYRSTADDQALVRAAEKLWHYPRLTGPWPSREEYGSSVHITPDMLPRDSTLSLYGLLELLDGRQAACYAWVVRPPGGSDSLSLCLPGGMLERLFPVAYNPMSVKRNPWLRDIERLLADIAEWVYGVAPFELAVLGECAAAVAVDAADLTREALAPGGFILPDELWRRLEPPLESRPLSHGLRHIPLNY
jgi:hypothetical protein